MTSNSPTPDVNPYASPSADASVRDEVAGDVAAQPDRPHWWHLAMVLGCAVAAFGGQMWSGYLSLDYMLQFAFVQLAMMVIQGLMLGVTMTSVVVMLQRFVLRRPFLQQPGEWMLVAAGVTGWINVVAQWCIPGEALNGFSPFYTFVLFVVQSTLLVIGGFLLRNAVLWTISLVSWGFALAAASLMQFHMIATVLEQATGIPAWMQTIALVVFAITSIAGSLCFVGAIVVDWRRRVRRGWVHWTALAWLAAFIALAVISTVLGTFHLI